MKVLLVDDEPFARKRLRTLLADERAVEVVGECGSAAAARALIKQADPDVVLLDVTMPGEDGIALTRSLESDGRPVVIFVTAHARFAVDAFEARALDYLLKPVRPARLRLALTRAREKMGVARSVGTTDEALGFIRRISVKTGSQVLFIEVGKIDWIEAAGNYVVLHSEGQNHVVRQTMAALERNLPPRQFIRLSRSVIANVETVDAVQRTGRGEYSVVLKVGKTIEATCGLRALEQWAKFGT